jgi:long-chain fatty acid transport protein
LRRRPHPALSLLARSSALACAASLVALLVVLASPRPAQASGFASARFGGEHGNVTTTNPTALYYNPAGIGFSRGLHLFVDGNLAWRRLSWDHTEVSAEPEPVGSEGANSGHAEQSKLFGAPMLGASLRLGSLALGAAVFVPFGGRSEWSKNGAFKNSAAYPSAADGVQRWHSIRGALTYLYGSAGAAYRIGPLSLGATFNIIHSSVQSLRAKNFAGDTLPDVDSEGRADLDVSGIQASFGLGVMFEASADQLWLAASYQAQPGLGAMQLDGTLEITDRGVSGDRDVTLDQALPDIVRAGARWRATQTLELRLFGDITRWSVLQTQCLALTGRRCVVTSSGADPNGGVIPLNLLRRWNDTFGVRAGASTWFLPELEAFVGLGFETAATPDATLDPELPDAQNVALALGVRWQPIEALFVSTSYTHLFYFERDNTGQSELPLSDVPTRRPDSGGVYQQSIGIFNLNLEKEF